VFLNHTPGSEREPTEGLKHVPGKYGNIILAPQPDDDPNNPLNFPLYKKRLMMAITSLGVCLHGATVSPLLNAGLVQIAAELDTSVTNVVQASGYQLLVVALMVLLVNAFSRKWGKRPTFIFSSIIGIIGTIIGATATSYSGILAARIIQGFGVAAYESLALSMIGDLFFVHERGLYISIVSLLLGGVSNFSSVICGPITVHLGWKYLFNLLILFEGVHLLLQYLFVPETQHRQATPILTSNSSSPKESAVGIEDIDTLRPTFSPKRPWTQELHIFTGTYSSKNFLVLLCVPLLACLNLSILWSVLISGYFLSLYVATAYLLSQIFTAPPYLLTSSGVGYLSLGPFIGGLLASVLASVINDPIARRCSQKNNGYYEPEYRLLLGAGGALAIAGFVSFGYTVQTERSYYLTAFLHGLGLFGIMFVLISAASYALDSFRSMRTEIFLTSMAVKNGIIFGYSYFINDWALRAGTFQVMWILSSVAGGLLLTFPMVFLFGKKYRALWSSSEIVMKLSSLGFEDVEVEEQRATPE
jgi:MFS family permease